jgi:hypothetical protein
MNFASPVQTAEEVCACGYMPLSTHKPPSRWKEHLAHPTPLFWVELFICMSMQHGLFKCVCNCTHVCVRMCVCVCIKRFQTSLVKHCIHGHHYTADAQELLQHKPPDAGLWGMLGWSGMQQLLTAWKGWCLLCRGPHKQERGQIG